MWTRFGVVYQKRIRLISSRKPLPDGIRPIYFGSLNPSTPYLELGYGIDNIFKLIRIQAIHRLNYLDTPNNGIPASPFALKASATINF